MYKVELYVRVRRACMVDGMSTRKAARVFGLHRDTVRKMLKYSVPPRYRRQSQPRRPKLDSNRALNPTGTDQSIQFSPIHPSASRRSTPPYGFSPLRLAEPRSDSAFASLI